jgi:4-aminobutyrate aminotransferase
VNDAAGNDLLRRDADLFFHQEGSSPCMAALEAAEGIWLTDLDGNRYVDLHGNTAHHLGYRHPRLIAALRDQLDRMTFAPRRFANENAVQLAETLVARWPGPRAKVLFATGGSDAIEIALRLALVATGRQEIISLEGSYHGHGFGALGLSSIAVDPRLAWTRPARHHVTPYWQPGGAERMLDEIERLLARSGGGVAAVVAEPIRSNCHVPPAWLWPQVRALCTRHAVKLIFDEIPSGLGKTGRFFAFEHVGAVPDAVVLGKALGGGMLPIAAVLADAAFDVAPELNLGHYTHEKNPITTRIARETIAVIDDDRLVDRAARLGDHAARAVAALAARCDRVRGWRGIGLLGAIELADGVDAAAAMRACFRHGISTVTKPGNALGFSPPLIISEADIDETLDRIDQAVRAL